MKTMNKVTEVTVGKNEAGMHEYQDTGKAIEMGEKAYTIKTEDMMSGESKILYFQDKCNAEYFNIV